MTGYLTFTYKNSDCRVAKDRMYTPEGLWLKPNNNLQRVGLSDYIQQKIGSVSYVDYYQVGIELAPGDVLATIETGEINLDLLSPTHGYLASNNPYLLNSPRAINQDPYEDGWILEIAPKDFQSVLAQLLTPDSYLELVKKEFKE